MKKSVFKLSLVIVMILVVIAANNGGLFHKRAVSVLKNVVGGFDLSSVDIQGEAAVLLDEATGRVLFKKNEKKRMYPASTTKVLTALIAIEKGNLDELVTVGNEVQLRAIDESSAGLIEGQHLKLRDLIAALLLPSGNDAARTIARYIAQQDDGKDLSPEESMEYFAELMNQKARQIGAKDSNFVNPHGLHDARHYTTAYDMALIAREAMTNDTFRSFVKLEKYQTSTDQVSLAFSNRNKLLQHDSEFYFRGANGVKTGYTEKAGYCLVASASQSEANLISVVLHSTSTDVWNDSKEMLQFGFEKLRNGKNYSIKN